MLEQHQHLAPIRSQVLKFAHANVPSTALLHLRLQRVPVR